MVEVERVQVLASTYLSNDTIPSHMIRPENEQPRNTTFRSSEKLQQLPEVPVIDFSGPNGEEKLVETILDASCEWGLFQIVNHGIPSDVISNFQKVGQKFFDLPQEEKELYAKTPGEDLKNIQGYGTKLLDHIPNNGWLDHIFNKIWPPSVINYDFWPKNPPEYREAVEEYASCLHKVVDKLLSNLSVGLGLEKHEVKEAVGGDDLVYDMKINYYPPCPRPDLALGSGAHTDLCVVTILLLDDIQGLQVFRDGNWIDVNFVSNGLIIHIGDQIEILSNGRCKSALHRSKVDKDKIRMSWPVFMEPPLEFEVGPHPKLVSENNPPKYKAKKFSDYAQCKLTGTPQ